MTRGSDIIAAERQRQIDEEGWSEQHDRAHPWGVLATAGAVYAMPGHVREQRVFNETLRKILWPWDEKWWKPAPWKRGAGSSEAFDARVRELAKAGALIAAEIDRMYVDEEALQRMIADREARQAQQEEA